MSVIAEIRDSKFFKLIADISVIHWLITGTLGIVTALEAAVHDKPLETVILYFVGVCALALCALHYGARALERWEPHKATVRRIPGSVKRLIVPIAALVMVLVFWFAWPKLRATKENPASPTTATAAGNNGLSQTSTRTPDRGELAQDETTTEAPVKDRAASPQVLASEKGSLKDRPTKKTSRIAQGQTAVAPTAAVQNDPSRQKLTAANNDLGQSPTYGVTNPVGSIVNQNSTNQGAQTVINLTPPKRVLTTAQASALDTLALSIPESQGVEIDAENVKECKDYARQIYDALTKEEGKYKARITLAVAVGPWEGSGQPPAGTVVCVTDDKSPAYGTAEHLADILAADKSDSVTRGKCAEIPGNEAKIIIAER